MAAFPTLPAVLSSNDELETGVNQDRTTNGELYGASFWSASKRRLNPRFEWLTPAEAASIDSHYSAHRVASFSITLNGVTYTVMYAGENAIKRTFRAGGLFDYEVAVREV